MFFAYSLIACHQSKSCHIHTIRFPPAVRSNAARCKLPFALRPGPSRLPRVIERTKEMTKETMKEMTKERQRKVTPIRSSIFLYRRGHKGRRGEKERSLLVLSTQSLASSPFHFHCASSSARAGTRLPTSVVERKSSTGLPHRVSARRCRILNQSFPLPGLSAHRIFC
jgi:hypothetical protein